MISEKRKIVIDLIMVGLALFTLVLLAIELSLSLNEEQTNKGI